MPIKRARCPHCDKLLIPPMGNPQSPVLLVGDFPGHEETIQGSPFAFGQRANETRSGDILKNELLRVGIMWNSVLVTNLWQHGKATKIEIIPSKTGKGKGKEVKVPACPPEWHLDQLVRLFTGRTHVLLMGSEVTMSLTGEKADTLLGTQVKKIPGVKGVNFWVSPNPSLVFGQPIGELRLAFRRFADDVQKKVKTK